jgi:uncharacterized membrane protein (DUF485 family)
MSDMTERGSAPQDAGAPDPRAGTVDWERIESSEEFRELTRRRHGFLAVASLAFLGCFLAYLLLATFAPGFMGTRVLGGVPVAFLAAVSQVLMTWAVTWAYLRKADAEFTPLEERVLQTAQARFTRPVDAEAAAGAGSRADGRGTVAPAERSPR